MNRIPLEHEGAPRPIEPPSAPEHLERLATPVLVIVGTLDLPYQLKRARAIVERVPDGRLVTLGGVAHLPQLESPDVVASLIRDCVSPT